MTGGQSIIAENARVNGWQDRAWLIGSAGAATVMAALLAVGARFWVAAVMASLLVVAGGAVSTRAGLSRLDEATRRRHVRSIAIGLILASMVIIFYAATIVRLGGNVMNRPM